MKNQQTMRWLLAAALGAALPLAAQEPPAAPTPTLQEEDRTMYLDENFMPSNQRRAAYALRTAPVRDEALGAWHVRLEFPDTPGVLAFETYATDLDLSQVKFVRFRKYYYENGQLLRETYFNDQGEELLGGCVYFENGQVKQKVTALPNGRDSISETYHENGQLMSRTLYHGAEMADGEHVSYGANGAVSSRSYQRNGQMDGVEESFYADGKLHRRGQYVKGQREGEFVMLAQDGKVLAKTVWVHGQPDGWSFESHGNGKLSNKTLYRKGSVLSLEKWGANGHPIFAWQKDAQGRDHGDTTEWHANGVRASVTPFVAGQRHGLLQTWYSDGGLRQIVPYEHGKKHGIERHWDKAGKLVLEQAWQDGQPVTGS
ncbi:MULTISPECIES: toxin-antitoxin system YwqK family antitoxin [unclassified Janthinobacterium]|uniref:toxin-antitoxin system YwqK family antitoxin n=1 Tax=unclassified Janthinobacterium TaxID=2610881 RepID=UPI001E58D8CD|nr:MULTISPECIES: toxin-antitoxin system YwqK family antitoxin [unclassified Janthinobacterium]MCC7644163.1 toxin-antitoxin system YwqK family antitoxin [Janthinobacterium sp. EB271-G4-3-1]MCC7693309.1 toxin-antitoxin system YwqK family antitoxin [Janthinobacterium sp. EB271-G4-3-2]